MDVKQAYEIVLKRNPGMYALAALDFGNFFTFSMRPLTVAPNETYYSGVTVDAVDKKTGRVYYYQLTSDIDAYYAAEEIKLENVFNSKIRR